MPISKKARISREQKKGDLAGTRAAVNPNGTPVKAPKPMSQCQNCRKELVNNQKIALKTHAETHDQKTWPPEKCFPNDF